MQGHGGATAASHRKPKSREVSPRFLSPASSAASSSADYGGHESPNTVLSPIKQKPARSSVDSRKPKSLKNSGFLRGLWPSTAAPSPKPRKPDTLGDFIGSERREEKKSKGKLLDRNLSALNRQRSCTEFSRFESDRSISSKENRNPIFGGSMRYSAGKFKFPGKIKDSGDFSEEEDGGNILPGRFSIDEVAVRKNSFFKPLQEPETHDSSSEYSDGGPSFDFPASYMAPTVSSRKHRIDVPSRFMQDLNLSSRSRRWSGDSNSSENSVLGLKKKGSGDWASSPARTGSPRPPLVENKGKMAAMMNPKPPTSPSRGKGMGNILSKGFELLKGSKKSSSSTSTASASSLGPGSAENVHQLRLLHNRLTQWRFGNARAEVANDSLVKQAKEKSQHVGIALIELRRSVQQKKFQLQKEKLELKLNYLLHSQMKALEVWANMERQHSSALSNTTDSLHSVVCKIPLIHGAKVEPQLASVAMFHASELATKINTMITTFQPKVETTVGVVAELAMVVIQEKQLLEECLDLFKFISALEIEERSLRSSMMQLRIMQQQIGILT